MSFIIINNSKFNIKLCFNFICFMTHSEILVQNFHNLLAECLEFKKFEKFRQVFESATKFDIFIDVQKIPNRFEIISRLVLNCIQEISAGYQTSSLGKIIEILRFCNEFNLFYREILSKDLELLNRIKKDKILLANLKDLYGEISNSFIFYIVKVMPKTLYDYFIGETNEFSFYTSSDIMSYVYIFFDRYSIYGLSVENLGKVRRFITNFKKKCEENKSNFQETEIQNEDGKCIEFNFKNKKHLVSPQNLMKNIDKIKDKENYNYYNISMVLFGGLGPQGHGFSYSTPKGEIVEICSDIKENDAIIIKYKQFLRKQFLIRLRKELILKNIKNIIIQKIIDYLLEIIYKKEIINYYKKDLILGQINSFLGENLKAYYNNDIEFHNLMNKISNAIKMILRPIKMIDQFKCRMDLVDRGEIRSEDIAKLTSLKGKSHYDVLRERFFFQYIVKWFYEIHSSKNL